MTKPHTKVSAVALFYPGIIKLLLSGDTVGQGMLEEADVLKWAFMCVCSLELAQPVVCGYAHTAWKQEVVLSIYM